MEVAGIVRWLYALGIGFLLYAAALFLFTLYRSTEAANVATIVCIFISAALFAAAIALDFRQRRIYKKRDTNSSTLVLTYGA